MVLKRTVADEETSNPERGQSDNENARLFLFHDVESGPRIPPDPVESGLICYSPDTLIVGSINGLVCSAGHAGFHSHPSPDDIWIWNPSTRLSKKLPIGKHTYARFTNTQVTFAFCWDSSADVYKIVKMVSKKCEPTKAEVWTSTSDSWKEINDLDGFCFYNPTHFEHLAPATHCDVVVETSPYWVVLDYDENVFAASFDVKTDELKLFPFPSTSLFSVGFLSQIISKRLVVTSFERCFAVLDLSDYIINEHIITSYVYDLWKMDHRGQWTKGKLPVSIDFYFCYCSNTIDGKLVLQGNEGIKLYDLETKESRILHGDRRSCGCVGSTFDFVISSVSMERFEPFGRDFCLLINLIWPAGLQMYSNPDAPRKQFVLQTEEPTKAEEMEDDPDELNISAPLWERQNHLNY